MTPTLKAPYLERHFTPKEVAQAWGRSSQWVRDLFRRENGVLHKKGRKGRVTLLIPESIVRRVHERLRAE